MGSRPSVLGRNQKKERNLIRRQCKNLFRCPSPKIVPLLVVVELSLELQDGEGESHGRGAGGGGRSSLLSTDITSANKPKKNTTMIDV